MVRDGLQKYWRSLLVVAISAALVAAMLWLSDRVDERSGVAAERLVAILFLVSIVSLWAMMALRIWARKHET